MLMAGHLISKQCLRSLYQAFILAPDNRLDDLSGRYLSSSVVAERIRFARSVTDS